MPHTLLLADDSVTIQRVIELTFADEDMQVFAVSDGEQAIARIEASPPDIVLADVGMPGKNGYEVAQHIKHSPHLAHIPVILLTGAFEPVDEAQAAGCEGVLAKPFEPQLVVGRVRELLAGGARSPVPAAVSTSAAAAQPEAPAPEERGHHGSWPMPVGEPPAGSPANTMPPDLDRYFDRLDEAFASLGAPAHEASPGPAVPVESAATGSGDLDWFGSTQTPAADARDTAAAGPAGGVPVHESDHAAPLSYASPLTEFDRLGELSPAGPGSEVEPHASEPPEEPPVASSAHSPLEPVISAHTEPVPANEPRAETPPPAAPAPVVVQPAAAAAPAVSGLPTLADAFAALLAAEQQDTSGEAAAWPPALTPNDQQLEEIVQRVLGRMSDRVVRETVSGLVATIAERMIREEIERIKEAVR